MPDKEAGELHRDHDEPCAVGQARVIGAHGVLHRMLRRGGGQLHGHAGDSAAVSHMLARLQIVPILYGTREILCNVLNGRERQRLAEQVDALGHHDLRIVEQRVKALIGRVSGGHRAHQLRIDDRQYRHQLGRAAKANLLMGLQVGNHTPVIDLRTRAGDLRQRLIHQRLPLARAAAYIVPQVARVGGHCRHRNSGVQYRAAAQRHDEVAAVVSGNLRRFHDQFLCRVLPDIGADYIFCAGAGQLRLRLFQRAGGLGRLARRNQQQRFFAGQLLAAEFAQLAAAKQEMGRVIKIKVHHCRFLLF